jgi:ornithine cyclodeaminase
MADWLHPGLHITAMGSDSPEKHELDPAILNAADRFVVDRVSQSLERGEMRVAAESGAIVGFTPDEIGMICAGTRPGRDCEHEITVCDLTGTGVQDTAIADHATRVANTQNLGTRIAT